MTDFFRALWRGHLFAKPITVSAIQAAQEAKDVATVLKGLKHDDLDVNRAAANSLEMLREHLDVPHLSALAKVLARARTYDEIQESTGETAGPGLGQPVSRLVAETIDCIRHRNWQSLAKGMSPADVLRLMGQPDFMGTGREFIKAFNVGLVFNRGETEFFSLIHWVWRSAVDPQKWMLVIFQNDRLMDRHSFESRAS